MRPHSYCAMEQGALTLSMSVSKLSSVRSWVGLAKDDTAHEKTIACGDSINEV